MLRFVQIPPSPPVSTKGAGLGRRQLAAVAQKPLVGWNRKKLHKLRRADQIAHQFGGFFIGGVSRGIPKLFRFFEFLLHDGFRNCQIDLPAIIQVRAVMNPLPELRSADLRGRGILHQVKERHAARAPQPRFQVAEPDRYVLAQPGLRDIARGSLEQVSRGGAKIGKLLFDLVRARHQTVKTSRATGTSPGCATQVPSYPSPASRSLSARTCAMAFSLATGSFLIGMKAAMPPIA